LEAAQHAVSAPVFGELDGGTHEVALVFFELGLEAFLQGECVGCGAGKARQDSVVVEAADLAGRTLDDDVAERDLSVAADGDLIVAAYAQNGGCVKLFHGSFLLKDSHGGGWLPFQDEEGRDCGAGHACREEGARGGRVKQCQLRGGARSVAQSPYSF